MSKTAHEVRVATGRHRIPTGPISGARHFWQWWLAPVLRPAEIAGAARLYARYLRDWKRYERLAAPERLNFRDSYPCLRDRTAETPFDPHYFYQSAWAFRAIHRASPTWHVDVGSHSDFVGMLSAITRVTFVDIRPLRVEIQGLESLEGSLINMPFDSGTVASISCLHVAEHVGLGRYGDMLDPRGTEKAAAELARVLRPGGNLYLSLPIGQPRVCFNAHRIHSPKQIIRYFPGLELVDFAAVNDAGAFSEHAEPADYADARYACGLFRFRKNA